MSRAPLRYAPLVAVAVLLAPSIAAAVLGVWTPWGAWQQHLALAALLDGTVALESWGISNRLHERWDLGLGLLALGTLYGTAERWAPRALTWLLAAVEAGLAMAALAVCAVLVAVGAALDRPLFLGGLLIAAIATRGRAGAPRDLPSGWLRGLTAASAVAVTLYAALSLLEGATWTNPVFSWSRAWVDGPGRSGLLAGLAWCAPLPLLWATGLRVRTTPRPALMVGLVTLAVLVHEVVAAPARSVGVAAALSAWGLLTAVLLLAPRVQPSWPASPGLAWDPRRFAWAAVPTVAWGGLCAARGLVVFMATAPGALPPGVHHLADADCVFSLRHDPAGALWFTDRCRVALARLGLDDGELTRWRLQAGGVQQVEELGGPEGGTLFAAVQAPAAEARLNLLAVEGRSGPRAIDGGSGAGPDRPYIPLDGCWVSAWERVDGQVLLGCEDGTRPLVLDAAAREATPGPDLGLRMEDGAWDPRRRRLYGVALWDDPRLLAWSWPDGALQAEAHLGAFNWAVEALPDRDTVWASRFLEGAALVFDASELELLARVPLSFGIRAMRHDSSTGTVWAAAGYTGRLWAVEDQPPYRRRAFGLCGPTRDLALDGVGGVYVGTDCGIFGLHSQQLGLPWLAGPQRPGDP